MKAHGDLGVVDQREVSMAGAGARLPGSSIAAAWSSAMAAPGFRPEPPVARESLLERIGGAGLGVGGRRHGWGWEVAGEG